MFAKKTIAKLLLAGALFTASFQVTDAGCALPNGSAANGGCWGSNDNSGNRNYTCDVWYLWADCSKAASKALDTVVGS